MMNQLVTLQRALVSSPVASCSSHRRLKVICRTLTNTSTSTTICVEPSDALIDEPVSIKVSGLKRRQDVTLSANLKDGGKQMLSCAHYTADDQGHINCNKQPSVGGTYEGVEPNGLLWSMVQAGKHDRPIRLLKKDVTTPYQVSISVIPDHKDLSSIQSEGATSDILASTSIKRWYLDKDVKRLPVKDGRLRGALFVPPGEGPFPAVVDLFGGSGGLFDFRAALLASRGFLTLSLAYLFYDGLPAKYTDVDFKYFLEATDWLSQQPNASQKGIGVVGTSFGGAISYLLSVFCPKVKAVVVLNGLPFSPLLDQSIAGEHIEGYPPFLGEVDRNGYGKNNFAFKEGDIKMIPIWRSTAHILNLISEDDGSVDPEYQRMLLRLIPEEKMTTIQSVFYPGAGHLLEPPYTPLCAASYLGDQWGVFLRWGGEAKAHAFAQEDAWRRTLQHLKTHLSS